MKLDRTAHGAYHFSKQPKESTHFRDMSPEQLAEVFAYLQSVAFDYTAKAVPKMDKTVHSFRKNG